MLQLRQVSLSLSLGRETYWPHGGLKQQIALRDRNARHAPGCPLPVTHVPADSLRVRVCVHVCVHVCVRVCV